MFDDEDYEAFTEKDGEITVRPIDGEWYQPSAFIHKLAEMMNRGDSPIIAIVGDTNKGKSWCALRLIEILYDEVNLFDGEFDVNENFLFEAKPFVKKIRDIPMPDVEQSINPDREILAIDEAGALLNKFDYNDTFNRSVDKIFQTMRIKNCMYILMLPDIGDLDSSIRDDIDFLLTMYEPGRCKVTDVRKMRNRLDGKNVMLTYNWGMWYNDPPQNKERYLGEFGPQEQEGKQDPVDEMYEDMVQEEKEEERQRRSMF